MTSHRLPSFHRRPPRETSPLAALDDDARGRLAAYARAYGLSAEAAAAAVDRAVEAAAQEPWTTTEAAARRALLDDLRREPAARHPPPGDANRLRGALLPAAAAADGGGDWETVPASERAVIAGALFDGPDLIGLARGLGTHRLDVKARARRVLSRLAGEEATGSGLAAVRHMMTGEYALGLVPPDAVAAFRRGLALDPGLQALVAEWDARLAPWLTSAAQAPAPVSVGPEAAPPAPKAPRVPRRRRAGIAAALIALAVLAPAAAAWFVRGDVPTRGDAVLDALPTPRRAVAATGPETTRAAPTPSADRRVAAVGEGSRARSAAVSAPSLDTAATPRAPVVRTAARAPARPAREVEVPPSVTVYLHHGAADPAVAARAAEVAAALRRRGATVELIDSGGLAVSADRLRFFLPADAAAARLLAAAVPSLAVQDFSHYEPRPAPGTLELWLANRPPP
jgi:hypothetical protein